MRVWILKFLGLCLWGAFLFVPFVARADEGFDIVLPLDFAAHVKHENKKEGPYDIINMGYDFNDYTVPENEWSLRLNLGKDSVLRDDFKTDILHDRIQLDNGGRDSFKLGIGLRYTL